jgi:hypothetical protein
MNSKFILYENVPVLKQQIKIGWTRFFNKWEWEYHLIFSFKNKVTAGEAVRKTKNFINIFKNKRRGFKKIKYCGILLFVISPAGTHHIHMVIISDSWYPKTLSDIDNKDIRSAFPWMQTYWEDVYKYGTFRYRPVYDNKKLCEYLACTWNIDPNKPDHFDFECYRPGMLKKLMKNSV